MTLKYHNNQIIKLSTGTINKLLAVSNDGMLSYWNLDSYSKVCSTKFNTEAVKFSTSNNQFYLGFSDNDEIRVVENELSSRQLNVVGLDMTKKYEYMSYIMKILNGDTVTYEKIWDDWCVLPFQFNTMHFLSFCNSFKNLKSGLLRSCPLYSSISYDPYAVAINNNYQKCLGVLFESTKLLLTQNIYSLSFLPGTVLIQLNKQSHQLLHKFYSAIFRRFESEDFPKFANPLELPKFVFSETLIQNELNFFTKTHTSKQLAVFKNTESDDELGGTTKITLHKPDDTNVVPIVLFLSSISMNYYIGSNGSISFLDSLLWCPNKEIFRTKFIQSVLLSKWSELKKYQIAKFCAYGIFLMYLAIYLIYFHKTGYGELILWILVVLKASYDLYKMHNNPKIYFSDVWNYFDVLRLVFVSAYCILYFFFNRVSFELLTFSTLVSLVRGISYFRLFNETRYIIQLILSVIKDIKSFAILLAYSTVSFSLIFLIQNESKDDDETAKSFTYIDFFKMACLVNIGEYDYTNYTAIDWIIFTCVVIINIIIMMNMLIAIMGETFNNVRENLELADFIELTKIILDIEISLSSNREKVETTFFQLCEAEKALEVVDELAQDVKAIKKILKKAFENKKKAV